MDPDLLLVIGIVLGGLAIPSFLAAFSESRPPRAAAALMLAAGALVVLAVLRKPGGYALADVPQAFFRVIGGLLN
ncbi:MAG TPA: hypothetical protein VGA75_02415 [Paracoccaceae bacterium]